MTKLHVTLTLIFKLDLDIVKIYLYMENKGLTLAVQKLQHEQTQTDLSAIITCPQTWMVIRLVVFE